MNIQKRKIIAIVGPTASGKTAVGVKLAREFNGEIVSADSRQVFRGLDIGTGKDLAEYGEVKYHMIDICEPEEDFNLFKYLELARAVIEDIFSRGKLPIIVGGTGLYIQALTQGFALEKIQNSKFKIQNYSERFTHGLLDRGALNSKTVSELQNILQELDIKAYENLADKKNPHRLIRAIERAQSREVITKEKPDFEVLQIGLDWPREELNKRIDKRVDDRFEQGMLGEAELLLKSGVDPEWLLKLGLEYRIMTSFLLEIAKLLNCSIADLTPTLSLLRRGSVDITMEQYNNDFELMKDQLKLRSHQYAKRQMTWFKRFPEITWEKDYKKISELVENYLN
ncbi:MAG: tRNA (adenosine(37)-N6)-dimethylallyltransferase MiaA [Patescibacteria group bacterium]